MSFWQAILYFLREAGLSLARSWKISLVAVATIALSLFLCGFFVLVTGNVSSSISRFSDQAKVVVYLLPSTGQDTVDQLLREIEAAPWIRSARHVGIVEARQRFESQFPDLADLLADGAEAPLPASIEATLGKVGEQEAFDRWLEALRTHPGVDLVDDDREWLSQLTTMVALARGVGLTLGAALLAAAVFTTASVVRLIAYMYLEEIAVMRLVGATEFYIRGPFWAEGLLQGLLGGLAALSTLHLTLWALRERTDGGIWLSTLTTDSLPWQQQLLLVSIGGAAGLLGAVLSLRREQLSVDPIE